MDIIEKKQTNITGQSGLTEQSIPGIKSIISDRSVCGEIASRLSTVSLHSARRNTKNEKKNMSTVLLKELKNQGDDSIRAQ